MTSERAMIHVEHRLERYQDQQDADYRTYLEEDRRRASLSPRERKIEDLEHEHAYLEREVRAIQRNHDITHEEWHDETDRCIARLSAVAIELENEKMRAELDLIAATVLLHCEGLTKLNMRRVEIEQRLSGEVAR
jgi:hypothetical protein